MNQVIKKHPINRYLTKQALPSMDHDRLPDPKSNLKLIIVIPALAEVDHISDTLDSLLIGSRRLEEAEVIVVVNHSTKANSSTIENNLRTMTLLNNRKVEALAIHCIDRASNGVSLDSNLAGVGLARRIGMDSALARLDQAGQPGRSAIACLDADATVSPGYIDHLLTVFDQDEPPVAGVCHFEHPLPTDPKLKEAIIYYELWLRYLEYGLQLCRSPFAYHSMGSSMVVSAISYALADGMPCRQAAEDFHFLQKVTKISREKGIVKLPQITVQPEARCSDRVLFGTGKAMKESRTYGVHGYREVYKPELFFELKDFFDSFRNGNKKLEKIKQASSKTINKFMLQEGGWSVFERLQKNYNEQNHFNLACHHWFDGLKIVRFLNQNSNNEKQDILLALPKMMENLEPTEHWELDEMKFGTELERAMLWLKRLREHWKKSYS